MKIVPNKIIRLIDLKNDFNILHIPYSKYTAEYELLHSKTR